MDRKLGGLIVLALAGCASMTDIVPAGRDTYLVSTTDIMGMSNSGSMRAAQLKRANAYCESQGKRMKAVSTEGSGVPWMTPTDASLTFQCLAETDPQWGAAPLPTAHHSEVTIHTDHPAPQPCQNSDGSACTPTHR